MKKYLSLVLALSFVVTLSAQAPHREDRHNGKKEKIEDVIKDLTPQQKSKIDAITQRSSKNIEGCRKQLQAVRDSIRFYMDSRDDNSSKVFPLYDREARLQAELSKEYYRTKVAVDAVLTPEQFARFQQHIKSKREKKTKLSANPATKKAQRNDAPKSKKSQK